jgi:uncharacterized protein YhaN
MSENPLAKLMEAMKQKQEKELRDMQFRQQEQLFELALQKVDTLQAQLADREQKIAALEQQKTSFASRPEPFLFLHLWSQQLFR